MSLSIMAQQCTLPSFWSSMAASDKPANASERKCTMETRASTVIGILNNGGGKPMTTDQIFDKALAKDSEITRNTIAHALRTLLQQGKVDKDVQKIKPGVRLAYWRMV